MELVNLTCLRTGSLMCMLSGCACCDHEEPDIWITGCEMGCRAVAVSLIYNAKK